MIELSKGAMNLLRRHTARLGHIWRIDRDDGQEPIQLTVHDQMLNRINGLHFNPRPGLSMTANRRAAGIGEKSVEISGPIGADGGITYSDLHQGRVWGCVVTQELVDWAYDFGPSLTKNTWFVTDITYDDVSWTLALTGITSRLKGKRGEVFSRLCQNELGIQNLLSSSQVQTSSACPVDINQYPMRVEAIAVIDSTTAYGQDPTKRIIYVKKAGGVNGLSNAAHTTGDYAVSYFKHGRIVFSSGELDGLQENVYAEVDVGSSARAAGVRAFTVMRPLPETPAVGDTLTAYVGCDKQWMTCKRKFDALQGDVSTWPGTSGGFRGFPDIPGTDRATTYPPARGQ